MPIYPFRCMSCGRADEAIRSVATRDDPCPCPECGAAMARVPGTSAIAFVTKGGNLCHSHTTGHSTKGNRRPVTIGWGHGIGQRKRGTPKLTRNADGTVAVDVAARAA